MFQNAPKILIADDEEGIRLVLRDLLTGEGYAIEEAKDGEEALEKIKSDHFHMALIDIKMPKIDGIGVVKEIRRIGTLFKKFAA